MKGDTAKRSNLLILGISIGTQPQVGVTAPEPALGDLGDFVAGGDASTELKDLVSAKAADCADTSAISRLPSISSSGRYVAFESNLDSLAPGDRNNCRPDIFVFDRVSGDLERVSVSNPGVGGEARSLDPQIASDASAIVFSSDASGLIGMFNDTNFARDIFVRDFKSGVTSRVSTDSGGLELPGASFSPSIGGPFARYVAFNYSGQLAVKDRIGGTLILGASISGAPRISRDGNYVAFRQLGSGLPAVYDRVGDAVLPVDPRVDANFTCEFASDFLRVSEEPRLGFLCFTASDDGMVRVQENRTTLVVTDSNFDSVMNFDFGVPEVVPTGGPFTAFHGVGEFSFLPGDQALVHVTERDPTTFLVVRDETLLLDISTGMTTPLTDVPAGGFEPVGDDLLETVAFTQFVGLDREVYVLDRTTGAVDLISRPVGFSSGQPVPLPSDAGADNRSGTAVAIIDKQSLVGAPGRNQVLLYTEEGRESDLTGVIDPPKDFVTADFGAAIAVSGDLMVIGAPGRRAAPPKGLGSLQAAIFERLGEGWQFKQALSTDGVGEDGFGASVAVDGETIVIGAPDDNEGGEGSGAAYVFDFSSGVAELVDKVKPPSGSRFGESVAVGQGQVVVGAPGKPDSNLTSGSVGLYELIGQNLTESGFLTGSDEAGDRFGASVAIAGGVAAVGAPMDGAGVGSAWLFDFEGARVLDTLRPPTGTPGAGFGTAVALDRSMLAVGAPGEIDNIDRAAGAVYLYGRDASSFEATGRVDGEAAGSDGDNFGAAVALDDGRMAVGAPEAGEESTGSASVYGSAQLVFNSGFERG